MKNHTYEVEVNGWDYKLFCDGVCYFSAEVEHKGEKRNGKPYHYRRF